jgi:hypothetical protein
MHDLPLRMARNFARGFDGDIEFPGLLEEAIFAVDVHIINN